MPQTHQNDKGHCINAIQRLLIWSGEGDLNPHEITPASTSSRVGLFQGLSTGLNLLIPM
jgi:hypothetical protein